MFMALPGHILYFHYFPSRAALKLFTVVGCVGKDDENRLCFVEMSLFKDNWNTSQECLLLCVLLQSPVSTLN